MSHHKHQENLHQAIHWIRNGHLFYKENKHQTEISLPWQIQGNRAFLIARLIRMNMTWLWPFSFAILNVFIAKNQFPISVHKRWHKTWACIISISNLSASQLYIDSSPKMAQSKWNLRLVSINRKEVSLSDGCVLQKCQSESSGGLHKGKAYFKINPK